MKLKSLEEIIKDAEISVINEAITVYGDTVEGKRRPRKL